MLDKIKTKISETAEKAENINCWYVCCAYVSPLTNIVCYRVGYFEERHDAEQWITKLKMRYTELKVPYYIATNTVDYTLGDITPFMNRK